MVLGDHREERARGIRLRRRIPHSLCDYTLPWVIMIRLSIPAVYTAAPIAGRSKLVRKGQPAIAQSVANPVLAHPQREGVE
jgi:hypothetical protein